MREKSEGSIKIREQRNEGIKKESGKEGVVDQWGVGGES